MDRVIVHLDADAFFASVEQSADPRLRGKPIAVGGEKRGIIASASYEARKFGIYTPMPTVQARRLCPRLIVLPGDFERYEQFSRWMFSYPQDFTPDVEITSIDEGYFDLSANPKPARDVAATVRKAIRQSLKITVSEGIASNKLVSQIASKLNKPDAFQEVPTGTETHFLAPLPNRWLPGIGPKTSARLNAAGLALVSHVAATPVDLLELLVGNQAPTLRQFARGIDTRPLVPARDPAKSFGTQQTFAADVTDEEFIDATLRRMADDLFARVRAEGRSIRTLTVKVRYNDMAEDQSSVSLREPTALETDVYGRLRSLLREAWRRRVSLRLVSLKLSHVYDGRFSPDLPLEAPARKRSASERLALTVDALREQHGRSVILRGHDFRLRTVPTEILPPPTLSETPHQSRSPAPAPTPTLPPAAAPTPPLTLPFRYPTPTRPQSTRLPTARALPVPPRVLPVHRSAPPRVTFVPLHVHSHYTFLDSILSPEAIVSLAQQHGCPAVALTDVGNLHGSAEFVLAARKAGIRPILGAEVRVEGHTVLVYVESSQGYANLCRLLSRLQRTDGVEEDSVASQQAAPFRRQDLDGLTTGLLAVSDAAALGELFPDRFYQATRSTRGGGAFPMVPAPSIHYATPADRLKFDIVQSIRTRTLLRQAHPEKRPGGSLHFRSAPELMALCGDNARWLANTVELAERCTFDYPFGKPQFPEFKPPDDSTPREFLRRLVFSGLRDRYGARASQFHAQVEEELRIIAEVGYEEYFLVVWGILQKCRQRGIEWITRGSAADSLVCYCLRISDVCPIRFDLYFKRFLNRERMSQNKLPDIDIDFAHDVKDDVVDLLFEHYGTSHCAVVGGFSTYQARAAFADIAKVLGVSEHQTRRFTEHFPWSASKDLPLLLRNNIECRDLPLDEEPYKTAVEMAGFLAGVPRNPKMHPCGVVLSRQPMLELTPTFRSAKGYPTTHLDMDAVEQVGLVKLDVLAQGGLAVLRDARRSLAQRGITIDFHSLEPWQDPKVWDMIASGGARAVHHIESPAMTSLCRMTNVREIDGLIGIVAVIRPGAANENKKLAFTRRYQGLEPVTYAHPSLEPCLRSTYGLVTFEEHILQICEAFAHLPPGRADVLRRALNKEKADVIEEIRGEFFACALAQGHTVEKTQEVWELATGFAGYAFNKAHSTAFGVEAYWGAWMKRYHPADFLAGVLTHGKGFYSPLVYVLECHRLGVTFLPPSINEPGPAFVPHGNTIRVPAVRAKGLGERITALIPTERQRRPYASLADFFHRIRPTPEEFEALIRAGAFDEFGARRTAQFWEAQWLHRTYLDSSDPNQAWLLPPMSLDHLPGTTLREPTRRERLDSETELFGFAISGHPLELFDEVAWDTYCPVNQLHRHLGQQVVTCGLVVEQRIHHQQGGEPMKFMSIADHTGIVETELFAATYRSHGLATVRYPVLEVEGRVEPFENGRGYTLRVFRAGRPRHKT